MSWEIDCVVVGPIQCNCYILSEPVSREAYIIDPGAESQELLAYLQKKKWNLQAMLITHAHIDHVGGIEIIFSHFGTPAYYHNGDTELYQNLRMQAQLFGVTPAQLQATQPQRGQASLQDHLGFPLGEGQIQVIYTPGHTPGSVCFRASGELDLVFTGDTLFAGSIGRTDLWGGSYEQIITSIHKRLLTLDDSIEVLPGHGPSTTIGEERRHNPFLKQ